MKLGGSIEGRHGVDEPGYTPPQTKAEKFAETGAKLQSAGQQMSSCGGSIIKMGCAGFVVVVIVLIAIALLTSSSHSSTPSSVVPPTTSEESTTTTEAPTELKIGSTATLKGQQSGEQVEATVVAYKETISPGEYDQPQSGMKFVAINLKLKNTGTATYSDSPSNGATILTANGQHGKTAILTGGECSEGFSESVKILPDESQEGCLPFEVPEGATPAKVQWTPSSGYGPETAEWSLSSAPAPGEAPRVKVGTGTGSGATSCGEEVFGSQDTSCPFAREVRKAFIAETLAKGKPPANITAYSPVTRKTYSLSCAIHYGTTVQCYTTEHASVSFPLAQVEKAWRRKGPIATGPPPTEEPAGG